MKALKVSDLIAVLILLLALGSECQHYEPFETGIQSIAPIAFNTSNQNYRNFTIGSSITMLSSNGLFVFSIMSFNYFVREAFCQKPINNQTSLRIMVSCSPNVYRLSYMFFDKGPNIYLQYAEWSSQAKNSTRIVDMSKWMSEVKFPLKSLAKNNLSTQYEIAAQNFITGVSMAQSSQQFSSSVLNHFGKVKLDPVYLNITIDNETKLWAPVSIRISASPTIQRVSFYTIIVIKEMVSMNMVFETISLNGDEGIQNLGLFAAINEISFYLLERSRYENISLDIDYYYKGPTITATNPMRRFSAEKLFAFKKGTNLNIKYIKVAQIFYRRCGNSQLHHIYLADTPKEGKFYKIRPAFSTDLVWEATSFGTIRLAKWKNSMSQKFNFVYQVIDGSNEVIILSAETKKSIRSELSRVNDTLQMGDRNDRDSKGSWTLDYRGTNGTQVAYFSMKSSYRIGVQNSTVVQGLPLVQVSINSSLTLSQQFLITEVSILDTNEAVDLSGVRNGINWKRGNFNHMTEILLTSGYASTALFNYYSIEEQKCYDKAFLESQLANSTLNNFQQSRDLAVLPYFVDINKTLSLDTISRNANTSAINTSTLQFAQGYMYGFVINRFTLNSFFAQINQGWTGYVFDSLNNIGVAQNANQVESSGENSAENKTQEKPLILMPVGCEKIKIINISQMQHECETCQQHYILHSPANSEFSNFSSEEKSKKCICEMGYFMNSTGQCTQCLFHPTNCKPQFKMSASLQNTIQTRLSLTQNRTLLITLQIISDGLFYRLASPIDSVLHKIVARVNGQIYTILKENIDNCANTQVSFSNLSFCLNMRVDNVLKSEKYAITLGTVIDATENPIDSYLLINETQSATDQLTNLVSSTIIKVSSDETANDYSLQQTLPQKVSKLYFSKIQTYQILISEVFTPQKVVNSVEPVVATLNYSSSVVMLAAPFLMDKINIFSLLQTNSLLYMISFLKFNKENQQQSQIKSVAKKIFIFRPEPFFKPFSLKPKQIISTNSQSYIELPRYATSFQNDVIYKQSLSDSLGYPQSLYTEGIASINFENGSQNYMTLTFNALVNMGIQILFMQAFIFVIMFFCSTVTEVKSCNEGEDEKNQTIKKKISYQIKRQNFVNLLKEASDKTWDYKKILKGKEGYHFMLQKRIQWQSLPQMSECEKIDIIDETSKLEQKKSSNPLCQSSHNQQKHSDFDEQKNQPSLKQQILFTVTGIKEKRCIFYSSFLMIQLISQVYLLYFELVKPLDSGSSDITLSLLNYFDMMFGLVVLFLVFAFPVLLINYEPLHLLKIVAIIQKFGGYAFHAEDQSIPSAIKNSNVQESHKDFLSKSYTYEQIYFDFCIVYYEIILIPFSIAIGPTIFYQTMPICLYQLFKLFWMFKKLKILDTLKTFTLFFIFGLSATWDYIDNQYLRTSILANIIIWGMYAVLSIEFAKLFKFLIVFLMKSLRLRKNSNQQSQDHSGKQKNQIKSRPSYNNEVSIMAIEEEPNFNIAKQKMQIQEFDSEQHMIEKENSIEKKKQKLESLKQKTVLLNQISKVRQNLRENLEYMRNRRRNLGQKNEENKQN